MLSKQKTSKIFLNYLPNLSNDQIDKLYQYYEMIEEKNQVMNLTGFTDERLVKEGLIESILLLEKAFDLSENKVYTLADIGAGAGFPSVPYLIVNKDKVKLSVIEPMQKRCLFLKEVSQKLNLNIEIITKRAEDVKDKKEYFDLVTARAVTELKKLLEISCQLGKIGSQQVFIKSKNINQELQDSEKIIKTLKINTEINTFYFENTRENNLVKVYKKNSAPESYPRPWAVISKEK
ncbi:16S rRNA (guanine(527)-N(7))-methyltransferase RsmG [Mycoplasma sp. 3341]|uniref:16S rRNA (guanine(527)-N(7))-methyltransferase RsmG n=1 Tax=Mycoplasma sp. 3341 TaxID=3447506 RepID=UPI003F659C2A